MGQDPDNYATNSRTKTDSFADIAVRRYSRRGLLKGSITAAAMTGLGFGTACSKTDNSVNSPPPESETGRSDLGAVSRFDFQEIEHGISQSHAVAEDHLAEVLIRWGEPLFADGPEFDPFDQSAAAQRVQFGYNNDYIGYLPLQPQKGQEQRALLCVNHEYPVNGLMFPELGPDMRSSLTAEQVKIAQAAVGNSIIEITRVDGQWRVNKESSYNRRITACETEFALSGPAAGHARLKTNSDSTGIRVVGTLNNCAGGMTPWKTYLSCEENFNFHFGGILASGHTEAANHARYNLPLDVFLWGTHDTRFDVGVEPNEPNRFGWVVEIDPLDPSSIPKKRTALGRFKHEGAENVIAPDGRLVVYMGDDQQFEYIYKFVSRDSVDRPNPLNNQDLLDSGTLYVARFFETGEVEWLPLEYGRGPLVAPEFSSQAEVLIEARRAADLVNATPMDRPEDIVPDPDTGRIYVMLTNNTRRKSTDPMNPRVRNQFGHIIEITEPERDFTSERSNWQVVVKCGDPEEVDHDASWHPETSSNGWFASPDNGVIDPVGRLWVSTDQGGKSKISGTSDGLWALETSGELRGQGKMFFRCPAGAEMCGPQFSEDGETLFLSVQHPGDREELMGEVRVDTAASLWPDFVPGHPPRPSIVAIKRKNGGSVG